MPTKTKKRYKTVSCETTIEAAILDGLMEVESLKDEMCETRDIMEEKFFGTSRFQTISDTADTLENVEFSPDVPECLPEDAKVTYYEDKPYGRSSLSRAMRMSNAISMISAGVAGVEAYMEKLSSDKSDLEAKAEEIRDDANDEIDGNDELTPEQKAKARDDADYAATEVEKQAEQLQDQYDALEEFKDEIENTISEIENVEFPGMYG
jgi:predicted RNase H-like nuclease (RuvC/YqgF family)